MELLTAVLVAIHLISVAAIVGGWLAHFKNPTVTVSQWWGSLAMIVSGLLLVVLIELDPAYPVNHLKIGVKLLIGVVVVITALLGRRRENQGQPVPTGLAHAVGGFGLINLLVAVLWRDYS